METVSYQNRIAIINDFTGFGRCSLTVEIPVISSLGVECCPLPTSILSNHTAFSSWFLDDYTEKMLPYMEEWEKLGVAFDGILTGFLSSERQIAIVRQMIEKFPERNGHKTFVIVDPIMGDHGKRYATYTEEMCRQIRQLVEVADMITPNLTEACILTGTPYKESGWTLQELSKVATQLCEMGVKQVVISGIAMGQFIGNILCEKGKGEIKLFRSKRVGIERCGTGDIFSSILAADAVNGVKLEDSVKKAMKFIKECIILTEQLSIPETNGVCFESLLKKLK